MNIIETKLKKWGNSLGVIIPIVAVDSNKLKENQKIKIIIVNDSKRNFNEVFGSLKGWKINSQKTKDELRKEWQD